MAALAADPANVDALATLTRTCQHIISQPGWADPAMSKAALDLGLTAAESAVEILPEHASANCFLGMLHSSSGNLRGAEAAFARALSANPRLAIAHAFAGYNAAFAGDAHKTLEAVQRALRIGGEDRRQAVWWFFAGFAQLLLGQSSNAAALLRKSLDRNPNYPSAQLFLAVALRQMGVTRDTVGVFGGFRDRFPNYQVAAFRQQWVSRSESPAYRSQIEPIFTEIVDLGLPG